MYYNKYFILVKLTAPKKNHAKGDFKRKENEKIHKL